MLITPRAEEVQLIVDILESGEFDSPQQMAKALLKQAADILSYRDWFALTHRYGAGQLGLNWAPFASHSEAARAAEKIAIGGLFSTVKLHSSGALLANATSSKRKGWCQTEGCGHADWLHLQDRSSRGKCGLETCPCTHFLK